MPILETGADHGRSAAQVRRLYAIAAENGLDHEDVAELLDQYGVDDPYQLARLDYDDFTNLVLPGLQPVQHHVRGRITDPHTGEVYEHEDDATDRPREVA